MKNKCVIILTLVTFFFVGFNVNLYANQNDFYGSWACKFSEDDFTIILRITISESSMTWEFEVLYEDDDMDSEKFSVGIVGWTEIFNADSETRTAYPNGFSFEIINEDDGETAEIEMFISRDKRQLTIPLLNDEMGDILIFRK